MENATEIKLSVSMETPSRFHPAMRPESSVDYKIIDDAGTKAGIYAIDFQHQNRDGTAEISRGIIDCDQQRMRVCLSKTRPSGFEARQDGIFWGSGPSWSERS